MTVGTAFIGRQPIYDSRLRVLAYELLFREGTANRAIFADVDQASRQTISAALMDFGLDRLIGEHKAFINLSEQTIVDGVPDLLPKDRVVLEILENVAVTDVVLDAVHALADKGYTFALDDFIYAPHLEPLLEVAKIVKVDVLDVDEGALRAQVNLLKNFDIELLAEKVETHEVFELCKSLGFDMFQGYFFCKPAVLTGRRVETSRLTALRVLAEVNNPKAGPYELEQIIVKDVSMSYKLLRYVGSAYFSRRKSVDTVKQAVMLLGTNAVRHWASLVILSSVEDTPGELLITSMVRAKMCALIGEALRDGSADSFFTVGLLSALDAIMNHPLESLLEELPLSDEVKRALLVREGRMGAALDCVLAYERGRFEESTLAGLTADQVVKAYLGAVAWVDSLVEGTGLR